MKRALPFLLLTGLATPFLAKPVHVDDANFLALARQAAATPWTPHSGTINWQGQTERAFDVLSNPPGIAWWLAPVANAEVWVAHLWMLPWLWLAIWGGMRLGSAVSGHGQAAALLLVGSPVAVLATHALTPDLPLLACTLAGMGGLLQCRPKHRWMWAMLVGAGALFRYSGAALIPVVVLWPLLRSQRREAIGLGMAAATPLTLLVLHDLHAYGAVHLVAMTGFQGVAHSGTDILHKASAAVGMLGGAVVLPLLCWSHTRRAVVGAMVGAGLGCTAISVLGLSGGAAISGLIATAAGGATLGGCWVVEDETDRLLLWWLGIGLCFLLYLRFTAARYWIPFMAPAVLLGLRRAQERWIQAAVALTLALSLGLATDDLEFSQAQQRSAQQAAQHGPGLIAGHWGFQHALEQRGWVALEDDSMLPPQGVLARSPNAWPQSATGCHALISSHTTADAWLGPRVHTRQGGANIHGFMISDQPPMPVIAPWSFGRDPQDTLELYRACPD